jgi:hypothetical protein
LSAIREAVRFRQLQSEQNDAQWLAGSELLPPHELAPECESLRDPEPLAITDPVGAVFYFFRAAAISVGTAMALLGVVVAVAKVVKLWQ